MHGGRGAVRDGEAVGVTLTGDELGVAVVVTPVGDNVGVGGRNVGVMVTDVAGEAVGETVAVAAVMVSDGDGSLPVGVGVLSSGVVVFSAAVLVGVAVAAALPVAVDEGVRVPVGSPPASVVVGLDVWV